MTTCRPMPPLPGLVAGYVRPSRKRPVGSAPVTRAIFRPSGTGNSPSTQVVGAGGAPSSDAAADGPVRPDPDCDAAGLSHRLAAAEVPTSTRAVAPATAV